MKILSEEYGFWFYAILSVIFAIIPFPLFWVSYMCVAAKEYWPLILFGGMTYFSWFTASSLFRKARNIKQSKQPRI